MKTGWLWFDNDPRRSPAEKVALAADRYRQKFGRSAGFCYVHPSAMGAAEVQCDAIRVVAATNVPPHHYFLSRAERASEEPAPA